MLPAADLPPAPNLLDYRLEFVVKGGGKLYVRQIQQFRRQRVQIGGLLARHERIFQQTPAREQFGINSVSIVFGPPRANDHLYVLTAPGALPCFVPQVKDLPSGVDGSLRVAGQTEEGSIHHVRLCGGCGWFAAYARTDQGRIYTMSPRAVADVETTQ